MGKAKKAPEAMARMSYLYQAANLMKTSGSKNSTSSSSTAKSAFARRVLSTNLGRSMALIEILEYSSSMTIYEKSNKKQTH